MWKGSATTCALALLHFLQCFSIGTSYVYSGDRTIIAHGRWDATTEEMIEETNPTSTTEIPLFFEDGAKAEVTARLGQTIMLPCRVRNLRKNSISWVRVRDQQMVLVSVGHVVYAADARLSLAPSGADDRNEAPDKIADWKLRLDHVTSHDAGEYRCQADTHPPTMHSIILHVRVPKVEVVDERGRAITEKFYKEGSIIELRCHLTHISNPQPPPRPGVAEMTVPAPHVLWRHFNALLNYDTRRGGVSVKTERWGDTGAISRLYIAQATRKDGGNYSCSLAPKDRAPDTDFLPTATVQLHVLKGENPLAMQRGTSSMSKNQSLCLLFGGVFATDLIHLIFGGRYAVCGVFQIILQSGYFVQGLVESAICSALSFIAQRVDLS